MYKVEHERWNCSTAESVIYFRSVGKGISRLVHAACSVPLLATCLPILSILIVMTGAGAKFYLDCADPLACLNFSLAHVVSGYQAPG